MIGLIFIRLTSFLFKLQATLSLCAFVNTARVERKNHRGIMVPMKRKNVQKKKGKKKETEYAKLTRLVKSTNENTVERLMTVIKTEGDDIRSEMNRRFDEVDERFSDINKQFSGIDKRFDSVDEQLREIRAEVADIRERVERLEEQGAAHAGYPKEIDHSIQRVSYLERHLGIAKSKRR